MQSSWTGKLLPKDMLFRISGVRESWSAELRCTADHFGVPKFSGCMFAGHQQDVQKYASLAGYLDILFIFTPKIGEGFHSDYFYLMGLVQPPSSWLTFLGNHRLTFHHFPVGTEAKDQQKSTVTGTIPLYYLDVPLEVNGSMVRISGL